MNKKKISKYLKRAKANKNRVNSSKKLDLDFSKLVSLVSKVINNIRKKRPETDYISIVRYYEEDKKIKHEILGYIKSKSAFNDLVSYVYHSNFIKKNYAEKSIINFIQDKIKEKIHKKQKVDKEDISKEIIEFFEKEHIWEIIFPLKNIELNVRFFNLGHHRVVKFNKTQLISWKKKLRRYYNKISWPKAARNSAKNFEFYYQRFLKDLPGVIIKVKTGDSTTALTKAREEFEVFMGCFKFMSYRWHRDYSSYRILEPGEDFKPWRINIGASDTAGYVSSGKNDNPLPFSINKSNLKKMRSLGLKKINNLLKEDKRNDFQNMILNSLKLFGEAVSDLNYSHRFVKFTTILEFLLIKRDESISHNLAERLSFLMRRKSQERQEYYNYIKELYKIRCDVVHNAKNNVTKEECEDIQSVVNNLLILLVNIHNKYADRNKFLDKIKEVKFGKKFTFQKKQIYVRYV
jgi:hypothetical protein